MNNMMLRFTWILAASFLIGCVVTLAPDRARATEIVQPSAVTDIVPRLRNLELDWKRVAEAVGDRRLTLSHPPQPLELGGKDYGDVRFQTGIAVFPLPASVVRQRVATAANHVHFAPEIKSAKQIESRPDGYAFRLENEIELPLVTLDIEYVVDHVYADNGDIVFAVREGDVDMSIGRWEFISAGPNRTIVAMNNWIDIGSSNMVLRRVLSSAPDLKLTIPVSAALVGIGQMRRGMLNPGTDVSNIPARRVQEPVIPLMTRDQELTQLLTQLGQHGTVIVAHQPQLLSAKEETVRLHFVSGARVVDAPIDTVKATATNFEHYNRLMKEIEQTRVLRKGKSIIVDFETDLGFGVFSIPFDYRVEYRWVSPNLLPFRRVSGDFRWLFGAWEFVALDQNRTLMVYSAARESGSASPLVNRLGNMIPNRRTVVAAGTSMLMMEHIPRHFPKGQNPREIRKPAASD